MNAVLPAADTLCLLSHWVSATQTIRTTIQTWWGGRRSSMGCNSPPSPGTEERSRSPVWAADGLCLVLPPLKKEKEGKLLVLLLPLWCFCLERSQQIWSDSTLLFVHNFSSCYNSTICITKDEAHVYRRKHQKVPCAQSSHACRVTPSHLRPTENKKIPPFSQQTLLTSLQPKGHKVPQLTKVRGEAWCIVNFCKHHVFPNFLSAYLSMLVLGEEW